MSMIGNQPGQASQRVTTTFNVGSTTATFTPTSGYTLGYLDVYLNGVKLINGDDYTASNGTTFTLTTSAVSGDVVEAVAYIPRGLSDGYTKAEHDASLTPTNVSDKANTSTGYFDLPSGTTAQRPASPSGGMIRHNTTTNYIEYYDTSTSTWIGFGSFQASGGTESDSGGYRYHTFTSSGTFSVLSGSKQIDYLIVAGGGSSQASQGQDAGGGGGGAGGYISGSMTITGGDYSITVGAGGSPGSGGSNSVFNGNTAIGGGRGGAYNNVTSSSGGSGGGAAYSVSASSGTAGQGFAGGAAGQGSPGYGGGGGGGANSVGGDCNGTDSPGNGGAGKQWLNGSYYAGGGGGATRSSSYTSTAPGSGGVGGGGQGSGAVNSYTGLNGTANTGGGAGGTSASTNAGRSGGSGIVIIRYAL